MDGWKEESVDDEKRIVEQTGAADVLCTVDHPNTSGDGFCVGDNLDPSVVESSNDIEMRDCSDLSNDNEMRECNDELVRTCMLYCFRVMVVDQLI